MQAGHQLHQSGLLVAAAVAAALLECKALLAALTPPPSPAVTDCISGKRALHRDVHCSRKLVGLQQEVGWLDRYACPLPCRAIPQQSIFHF